MSTGGLWRLLKLKDRIVVVSDWVECGVNFCVTDVCTPTARDTTASASTGSGQNRTCLGKWPYRAGRRCWSSIWRQVNNTGPRDVRGAVEPKRSDPATWWCFERDQNTTIWHVKVTTHLIWFIAQNCSTNHKNRAFTAYENKQEIQCIEMCKLRM